MSTEANLLLRARWAIYELCVCFDFMSDEDSELLRDLDERIGILDPTYVAEVPQ